MAINLLSNALLRVTGLDANRQVRERGREIVWPGIPLVETDTQDGYGKTQTTIDGVGKHEVTFNVNGYVPNLASLVGRDGTQLTLLVTTNTPQVAAADAADGAGTRQHELAYASQELLTSPCSVCRIRCRNLWSIGCNQQGQLRTIPAH